MIDYLKKYRPLWILIALSFGLGLVNYLLVTAPSAPISWLAMFFMGYFLVALSFLKFLDIGAFASQFKQYDLLSQKIPGYAHAYPFLELFIALCFLSHQLLLASGALAGVMGIAGAASIYQRLFLSGSSQSIACGCAGAHVKLPLGVMSIVENLMMVVMSVLIIFSLV